MFNVFARTSAWMNFLRKNLKGTKPSSYFMALFPFSIFYKGSVSIVLYSGEATSKNNARFVWMYGVHGFVSLIWQGPFHNDFVVHWSSIALSLSFFSISLSRSLILFLFCSPSLSLQILLLSDVRKKGFGGLQIAHRKSWGYGLSELQHLATFGPLHSNLILGVGQEIW